jgi:hypothetical protein
MKVGADPAKRGRPVIADHRVFCGAQDAGCDQRERRFADFARERLGLRLGGHDAVGEFDTARRAKIRSGLDGRGALAATGYTFW